ncbi:hypothetical protein J0H58_15260 [bacterium]|nr:hypothetical protein [bacterium]
MKPTNKPSGPASGDDTPVPPDVRRKQLAWAAVQLALGQSQVMGAVAGFYLLVTTGVSDLTLGVCAITGFVTLVSRAVFRGRSAAEMVVPAGRKPPDRGPRR